MFLRFFTFVEEGTLRTFFCRWVQAVTVALSYGAEEAVGCLLHTVPQLPLFLLFCEGTFHRQVEVCVFHHTLSLVSEVTTYVRLKIIV